jgi:hypothetical protein
VTWTWVLLVTSLRHLVAWAAQHGQVWQCAQAQHQQWLAHLLLLLLL